jgi:regulator of protease activity HflC (stomatin/prohibitin superfamily)
MLLETPAGKSTAAAETPPAAKRIPRKKSRWLLLKHRFLFMVCALLAAMFTLYFADRMFIMVQPGEVIVVYYLFFGGTHHNQIQGEGFHILAPWDNAYHYNVRSQTVTESMKVLSRDGLEINLDAVIRFRLIPAMVPYLHRQFGPDYVKSVVIPELKQAVQLVIGTFSAEELYSFQREASIDQILAKSQRMAANAYTDVDRVSLVNVTLPDRLQEAVQAKLEEEQSELAYDFRLKKEQKEAQRKKIEAEGYLNYQQLKGMPAGLISLKGIEATLELAKSTNAKVIVMGSGSNLPLVLGNVPDVTAAK